MAYVRKDELCDHCGELARLPIDETWADGSKVNPLKNSQGVTCPSCRYHLFDEFCRSQGCSAANPFLRIP